MEDSGPIVLPASGGWSKQGRGCSPFSPIGNIGKSSLESLVLVAPVIPIIPVEGVEICGNVDPLGSEPDEGTLDRHPLDIPWGSSKVNIGTEVPIKCGKDGR